MNNNSKWKSNKRGGKASSRGSQGFLNGKGSRKNQRRNYSRSEGRGRQFQKFVDTDHHNNESDFRLQNDWNCDNNRNNNYRGSEAGIFSWIRRTPVIPLMPHQHVNFEQQHDNDCHVVAHSNNNDLKEKDVQESVETPSAPQESCIEKPVAKRKISVNAASPISEATQAFKTPVETNLTLRIKKEKDIKQEKKSSSSSSCSESFSSEEELESEAKTVAVKLEAIPSSKPTPSPLNIKLKPSIANSGNSTIVKTAPKLKVLEPTSRASSSSFSDEKSEPDPPPKSVAKTDNKRKLQVEKDSKTKTLNNKNVSDDDVVCIGRLENQIVLEDESDNADVEDEDQTIEKTLNKKSKKSVKKTMEKCMICDKQGHASFQCQMICKNCSAPYHGYRTCPQPANLNTMLQLFIEFCMQQFQNFNAEKHIATTSCDSVPKPQVDSPHSASVTNKLSKLKRKTVMSSETKVSKKIKMSTSKKTKYKPDSDDSSDGGNDGDDTDSKTSSIEFEEF